MSKMYIDGWGEETDFDMVIDGGGNIDMTKICGCVDADTMNSCEEKCPRYYSCDNIGLASDLLAAYEAAGE